MAIIEHAGYYEYPLYNVNHTHTSCEIMFIVSGQVDITAGEKKVHLTDNDCLLIKSRQNHDVKVAENIEYKRFITVINPWELKKYLVCPELFAMLTDISKSGVIHVKNVPFLYDGFERMTDIFINGGNIYAQLSAALHVVSVIYEEVKPHKKQTGERSAKHFADAVRSYIEQNYAENIRITQLAKEYFISTGYLTHAFKAETGMSPREYLTHIRCTRAYELIRHTNMKFTDISDNTGFCCANDMSRKIREYYGCSPTEIRFEK